jgi:Bacteriocin-protection, YdeI or OmpD-Associated/Domain of unknown function (DUF1905)
MSDPLREWLKFWSMAGCLCTASLDVLSKVARMSTKAQSILFTDTIRKPVSHGAGRPWAFAKVPVQISQSHLRRGRITANISLGRSKFDALMEPDGQLGHWFKIPQRVIESESIQFGQEVQFGLTTLPEQPLPKVPASFLKLLKSNKASFETWEKTSTLAKIDWIHWIESAKQTKTRTKRQQDAIDMLQQGKARVCCFDPSGFYSKALCAPQEVES